MGHKKGILSTAGKRTLSSLLTPPVLINLGFGLTPTQVKSDLCGSLVGITEVRSFPTNKYYGNEAV